MAREKDSEAKASGTDVEQRLGLYERVAAQIASIAKSTAITVGSLAVAFTIFAGWGPLPGPAIDINLPFGGSASATSEESGPGFAGKGLPLIGELHLYIRPRRAGRCQAKLY